MKRLRGIGWRCGFWLLALVPVQFAGAAPAPWRFSGAERVVAVADIHGAYEELVEILQASRVIDTALAWTGGPAHLVVVGDVLDRGAGSRQALDLIMRLQQESAEQGGHVHFALGNHELMNLTGDLRYVSEQEYAAFANEELASARQAAFERFLGQSTDPADRPAMRAEFDRQFPPGYFAYRAAFKPSGHYGAWLLDQPLVVVIDDTAFVHGGLSEAVATLSGETINTDLAGDLREYAAVLDRLVRAGVLSDTMNFYDHPTALDRYAQQVTAGAATWSEGAAADAERLEDLQASLVFGLDGPLWYRGNVDCSALIEADSFEAAAAALGVRRVVVGHTPTVSRLVEMRMDGAVIRIDTGMLSSYYGGRAAALVLEDGAVSVIYGVGEPAASPRDDGHHELPLTITELETFLRDAEIAADVELDDGRRLTLRQGDLELEAVFHPARDRDVVPQVAAYRIDRLLGLDMVAAAVVREIDGRIGAVQLLPRDAIDEHVRAEQRAGGAAWCPLPRQIEAMYVFDALIFNTGRSRNQMLYDPQSFRLTLMGPQMAFRAARGRPAYLRDVEIELTSAWIARFEGLTEPRLQEAIGDVLSSRSIRALLQRRDALIAARD